MCIAYVCIFFRNTLSLTASRRILQPDEFDYRKTQCRHSFFIQHLVSPAVILFAHPQANGRESKRPDDHQRQHLDLLLTMMLVNLLVRISSNPILCWVCLCFFF